MNTPGGVKLSVIIPTKNRPVLLERALRSVAGQDLTGFEVCVVDNNTEPVTIDLTQAAVNKFAAEYPQISWLYVHSAKPFASGARNDGMAATKGGYIIFLDDDDEMLAGSLSKRVSVMGADPGLALLYCASYSKIYPYPFKMYRYYQYDKKRHTDKLLMMSCSNIMLNRAIFEHNHLNYDEEQSRMDDYDLCRRVIELGLKVASIPDPLLLIHIHPDTRISSHQLVSYDFKDALVRRWGHSVDDDVFNYAAGVHLWRKCFGTQDHTYAEVKASLKKDLGRELSTSFKAKYLLASISPQLFLAVYHLTVKLSQWYKNSRA